MLCLAWDSLYPSFSAVNTSTCRRPSLARCVRGARFALIGSSSQVPEQCLRFCWGSPRCPHTRPDTKFRGCLSLPGVVLHLPVAAATPSKGGKSPFWSGVINVLKLFLLRTVRTLSPEQSELHKCVKPQQTLHNRVSSCHFCILSVRLLPLKIGSFHASYPLLFRFCGGFFTS